MKYRIVELKNFTGNAVTIYSIIFGDDNKTLFDKFIEEHLNSFKNEIIFILDRLEAMGNETDE